MTIEEQIKDDEYRSPQEIARRAIVLTALIKVVFGEDQSPPIPNKPKHLILAKMRQHGLATRCFARPCALR